jgi:hypothetical protein
MTSSGPCEARAQAPLGWEEALSVVVYAAGQCTWMEGEDDLRKEC